VRARARRDNECGKAPGDSEADKVCGSEVRQGTLRSSTVRFSALSSGSSFP
jgi:hypothetical protein